MHFKTVSYRDSACTTMDAFSLLVPTDWAFEGGIQWRMDNVMMPATCGFKVSGGGVEMQALPGQAFFWTSLPHVRLSHPVGSTYLGAAVCPPLSAPEFLTRVMLPALRPEVDDLTVVREGPATDMGSALGFGATFEDCGSAGSSGAGARVRYRQGDKQYEEELYCTVTAFSFEIPAGGALIDCIFWIADHLFSFRAEQGRLDELKGVLQAIMYSFRLNPHWVGRSNRIVLLLKDRQINKPYSLRQLNAETACLAVGPDASLDSCALRQSAYRWIADSLSSDGATGEYYDPIQQICVRLPAGYTYAWASDAGEYLLSNSVDAYPYSGFTELWKIMEPISLGPPVGGPSPSPETCA